MSDPNSYIIEKDQEWVRRWEEREQHFRQEIVALRANYEGKIKNGNRMINKFEADLHRQQAIILKIRDDLPIIGKWIVRWAGYTE